jgi:uncharacterized protein YjiS (DUF1127 family)
MRVSSRTAAWQPLPHSSFSRGLTEATAAATRWLERARSRQPLSSLTARELDDIGLSREEAQREASRPFWR